MKPPFAWTIVVVVIISLIGSLYLYRKYFPKDGSSIDRAIALREHGHRAATEEWRWIQKLHPGARIFEWEHATMVYHGRFYSFYLLTTPRGNEDIYFDTGDPAK